MVNEWRLVFSRQAQKDARKIARAGLKGQVAALLDVVRADPFATPPHYEKPVGELHGLYSRRINLQHRLVYDVLQKEHTVHILRMWTHYE